MNKIEFLTIIENDAKEYRKDASNSVIRNRHMNELNNDQQIDQVVIDAILVDFINYIGMRQGLDYGMYTEDLRKDRSK